MTNKQTSNNNIKRYCNHTTGSKIYTRKAEHHDSKPPLHCTPSTVVCRSEQTSHCTPSTVVYRSEQTFMVVHSSDLKEHYLTWKHKRQLCTNILLFFYNLEGIMYNELTTAKLCIYICQSNKQAVLKEGICKICYAPNPQFKSGFVLPSS